MLGILAALLMICLFSSTKEGRDEAGEYIDRWARWLIIPTILLVGMLAWPFLQDWFALHGPAMIAP